MSCHNTHANTKLVYSHSNGCLLLTVPKWYAAGLVSIVDWLGDNLSQGVTCVKLLFAQGQESGLYITTWDWDQQYINNNKMLITHEPWTLSKNSWPVDWIERGGETCRGGEGSYINDWKAVQKLTIKILRWCCSCNLKITISLYLHPQPVTIKLG